MEDFLPVETEPKIGQPANIIFPENQNDESKIEEIISHNQPMEY